MAVTALDTAIKIGEEATTKAITMVNRERRLKWWLYRIKFLIKTGRPQSAMNMAEKALKFIDEEKDMANDLTGERVPPISWIYALHQVTGLFAVRGNKMSQEERARVRAILVGVLREIDDDKNRVFIQAGSGSRPEDSDPFV